jgi:hypothetical protein
MPQPSGRSPAGGGDPDDQVELANAQGGDVGSAAVRIVFRSFDGPGQRGRPAGDQAHHHPGWSAEGGRALGGIKHAEAPGRPRPDVD